MRRSTLNAHQPDAPDLSIHRTTAAQQSERSVAYISLGTNFGGDLRLGILESAILSIQKDVGLIDGCSCLYESLPGYDVVSGGKEVHDLTLPLHLNAVVRVTTEIKDPEVVLDALQAIEQQHGRDRSPTAVRLHRTLDLDLLFFQDREARSIQVNTKKLTLPHPRLHQRNFVLFPLCDIQPDLVHPNEGKTIKEFLLASLRKREEALSASSDDAGAVYTIDGNLAIPRRCFALNGHQLWTVKGGSEAAVSDTLRWIKEVMKKYRLEERTATNDSQLPAFAEGLLALKSFLLQEPKSPRLMGVLNVTPDSFSDGLKYYNNVEGAVKQAQQMMTDGAEIIDVGGEATNPFVQGEVSVQEEIQRVVPVIETLKKEIGENVFISVDTRRMPVADAAIAAGADVINDVSGGEADPSLLDFAVAKRFPLVVMHSRGTPKSMDGLAQYDDVVNEVAEYLTDKTNTLIRMGLPRKLPSGLPLLLGYSRKRFIGWAISKRQMGTQTKEEEGKTAQTNEAKEEEMANRDIAGIAVACWACTGTHGCVDILRVHDVKCLHSFAENQPGLGSNGSIHRRTKPTKGELHCRFKHIFPVVIARKGTSLTDEERLNSFSHLYQSRTVAILACSKMLNNAASMLHA